MSKIRLLVADDHTLFRQGVVGLLNSQPDMEVVGEVGDGKEAIQETIKLLPDVVLMDIGMPEVDGLDATRGITGQAPEVAVLLLTMHSREDYLFQALQAGAAGYVLKGADVHELLSAIRSVNQGEIYIYPTLIKNLLKDYLDVRNNGEKPRGLTNRERDVLVMIAGGKTAMDISQELHIAPHTVQNHRDNIMRKLGLHNKVELIKYAIRKGLVNVEQ